MTDKEIKLRLLNRAKLNLDSNRHALILVRDNEELVKECEAELNEEHQFLKNWIKEIRGSTQTVSDE